MVRCNPSEAHDAMLESFNLNQTNRLPLELMRSHSDKPSAESSRIIVDLFQSSSSKVASKKRLASDIPLLSVCVMVMAAMRLPCCPLSMALCSVSGTSARTVCVI